MVYRIRRRLRFPARKLKRRFGRTLRKKAFRLALRRPLSRYGGMTITRHCDSIYLVNSDANNFSITGTNTNNMFSIDNGLVGNQPLGKDVPFSFKFTHANLLNSGEFTALFDQYKILKVQVYATYAHNVSTAGGSTTLPQLSYFIDRDDAVVNSVQELRERMGVKRKQFTSNIRTRVMTVYNPTKMASLFDQATGALNVAMPIRGWVDCNDINIPHYGIKGVFENCLTSGTANVFAMRLDIKYTVAYRHVR